jgi:amidase
MSRITFHFALLLSLWAAPAFAQNDQIADKGIAELSADLAAGKVSSETLVKAYLNRISMIDDAGPRLNAVLATMPDAIAVAKDRDAERKAGRLRGTLHGIPILIKDNIEAAGPVPTTAGSLALKDNVTNRDAGLVARLKAAGAIILGKTNLSEWANIRDNSSTSGWSALGGLTRNPHVLNRNTCGSSSGSGAAMAAGFAAGTIGTETDGSITCPAGINGIVGFKPTVGLVSRRHVVPISHTQDTAGPMTATVRDAAIMLTAMAGNDPADAATKEANARKQDYAAALSKDALRGKRLGVMRDRLGSNPAILALFERNIALMKEAGAQIIDIKDTRTGLEKLGDAEFTVLLYELKADMASYLASVPNKTGPKTLGDLIAFNTANADKEMRWFGQDIFELAEAKGPLTDAAYKDALALSQRLAGPEGIDRLLAAYKVELLIGITNGPAWVTDLVNGDNFGGPAASQLPAVAGYPHLTVPMGTVQRLPIGISFIAGKWSDSEVLNVGYAFEQASLARVKPGYLSGFERD